MEYELPESISLAPLAERQIFQIVAQIQTGRLAKADINIALDKLCKLMLLLNNQPETDSELHANHALCPLFENIPDPTYNCKTRLYKPEKIKMMNFIKTAIVSIFLDKKERFPELLENTDDYIHMLKKTLEFYMIFIGIKELDPIYADYIMPLKDELNTIFGRNIVYERCRPTNRIYGCGRLIDLVKRSGNHVTDSKRIVFFAKQEDSDEITPETRPENFNVSGGGTRTKKSYRKKTIRKPKKMKNTTQK